MTSSKVSSKMKFRHVLAACTMIVASTSSSRAEPRASEPATQADLDRLEQKLEAQQRLLDKLIQLNEQYLRQLVSLAAEATQPSTGDPRPAIAKSMPEGKPADTRPVPSRPRPAARAVGTLVGKVTGGGGEAVVYIEDVTGNARGVATMNQLNKQFSPGVLVVAKGTKIEFPNRDAIFHNVFSVTPDNSFDLGSYRQGSSRSVTTTRPGVITVYCNLHPQMIGYILVTPSTLYVQTAADGTFRLPNVPIGHHRVAVWAPNAKPVTSEIDVTESEPVTVDLALVRGHAGPHTNKDGMPYGSYKE